MADILITIQGTDNLSGPAGTAAASLGRLEAAGTKTGGVLGAVFNSIGQGVGMAAGMAGINGLTGAFGLLGGAAVGLNSSLEQSKIAFTTMLGSAEKADAFLKEMAAFAANTPFEFPDLIDASKRMFAFGFEAKQVKPLLTAVGDAVAAVGGGSAVIDGVTTALGQMQAKGKVSAEEMNQLAERGIPAWDMLAKKMGLSTAEVMKLSEKGLIPAQTMIDAFMEGSASRFGGMMAKQAMTFQGAMSTIKDSLTMATATAFKPFFDLLSTGAVTLSTFVQSDTFTTWADAIATTMADVVRQLGDGFRTIQQVFAGEWAPDADAIEPFANMVGIAAVAVRDFISWVTGLPEPVKAAALGFVAVVAAAGPLSAILGAVGAVLGVVGTALAFLASPLGVVALAVAGLAAAWSVNFGGIQEKTAEFVEIVGRYFDGFVILVQQALTGDLASAFTNMKDMVIALGGELGPLLAAWGAEFVAWVAPMIPPLLAAAADLGLQLLTWIGAQVPVWTAAFVAWGTEWWNWLVLAAPLLIAAAVAFVQPLTDWVAAQIPLWTAQLLLWGQEFVAWVAPMIPPLLAALADLGGQALTWIAAQIPPIIAQLLLWGQQFIAWVAPQIPPLLAALGTLAVGLMGWIGQQIPGILAQLALWGAQFVAWVAPQILPLLAQLGGLYIKVQDWLLAQVEPMTKELAKWGFLFGAWVLGVAVPELAKALPGILVKLGEWTLEAVTAIPAILLKVGVAVAQGLYAGFLEAWPIIKGKIMEAIGSISLPSWTNGSGGGGPGLQTQSYTGAAPAGGWEKKAYEAAVAAGHPNPSEFVAQINQESGFNPNAVSPAGARGIAQFMPGTAASVGVDPMDPDAALAASARLMASYYKKYGNSASALAAYNAGEGAVQQYGGPPPYAETQQYIRSIQGATPQTSATPLNQMQRMPLGMGMSGGPPGSDPGRWPMLIQDVIDVAPDWQTAMAQIKRDGVETFTGVGVAATTGSAEMVTSSTDGLGNVTRIYSDATGVIGATITDATGQIVNTWGAMATTVPAQTETMAQTALTSVTNLGTGILTTITDAAGTTVATITDMGGQVTSQTATMANGVSLTMGDMAAGVLTSTTDLGTGVMTTVGDMSGNYITTITDLSGNVTSQVTTMGTAVALETATMSTAVATETGTMATDVLTSVTDLGDGVLTVVQTMSGDTTATITDMAGNVTSQITTMSGEVVTAAGTMSTDTVLAAGEMQTGVVDAATTMGIDAAAAAGTLASDLGDSFGTVVDLAGDVVVGLEAVGEVRIPAPDVSDVVDAMGEIVDAAEEAVDAIKDINSASKGGSSGGGGSGLGKRASGGPVSRGVGYLVGENGPEMFVPLSDGTIIPNSQMRGVSGSSNPYSPVGATMDGISGDFGLFIVQDITRLTNERAEATIAELTRLHQDLVDLTLGTAANFSDLADEISTARVALLLGIRAVEVATVAGSTRVVAEVAKLPNLLTQINASIGRISVGTTPRPVPPAPAPVVVPDPPRRGIVPGPVPGAGGGRPGVVMPIDRPPLRGVTPGPGVGTPRPIAPPDPSRGVTPGPGGARGVRGDSVFEGVVSAAAAMYQQVVGSTANMRVVSTDNVERMADGVTTSADRMGDDVGSILTGIEDSSFDDFIAAAGRVDDALFDMAANVTRSVKTMSLDLSDLADDVAATFGVMTDDMLDEIDLLGPEMVTALGTVQAKTVKATDDLANALVAKLGSTRGGAVQQLTLMGADMAAALVGVTTTTGSGPIKESKLLGEEITKAIGAAVTDKRQTNIVKPLVDAVVKGVKDALSAGEKEAGKADRVVSSDALGGRSRTDGPGVAELIEEVRALKATIAQARSIEVNYAQAGPTASLTHDVAVLESLSQGGT